MVVGQDAVAVNLAEAVLAKLRFGVTTASSVGDALRVLQTLKPEIVVATSADAGRIRMEAPEHLSVVEMTDQMRENPLELVEAIRERLRANLVK
jgi:CheY-like chemotaxis protein